MSLFQTGNFRLSSGQQSQFKIDADALTDEDIATCALMLVHRLPAFGAVEGVPTGGLRLADAMRPFIVEDSLIMLIVDDVMTSGGSMEKFREMVSGTCYRCGVPWHNEVEATLCYHRWSGPDTIGAVIFDRSLDGTPDWITPLWRLTP